MSKDKNQEVFRSQNSKDEFQNSFFSQYNYNYWMHKSHALLYFIDNKEAVKHLKFTGDIYADDVIVENLKMELHMSVFHSTESLFRLIFSIIRMPELPWIWMARCGHRELYKLIEKVKSKGLSSIKISPEIWLRANLYPSITSEQHKDYDKSKLSCNFVIQYLKALAGEYVDHNEYNSYKHGLHCFCGQQKLQAFNEKTDENVFSSQNDIIEFLEFEKVKKSEESYTNVRIKCKSYDHVRITR